MVKNINNIKEGVLNMIILGADHGGLKLKEKIKEYLQELNEDIVDVGAFEEDSEDNFSKYVHLIIKAFNLDTSAKIIAFCGSGVGMSIGLNKAKGIFGAVGHSIAEVKIAREHNNINALCLGGRTTSVEEAKKMVDAFLTTSHLGGKHLVRMNEIEIK